MFSVHSWSLLVFLFQSLIVWQVNSSPPVVSKSLPRSHRDWITGCVWTSDCMVTPDIEEMQTSEPQFSHFSMLYEKICCYDSKNLIVLFLKMSSSNDGRLCVWDAEAGVCIREISWRNPLTSICSQVSKRSAFPSERWRRAFWLDSGTVFWRFSHAFRDGTWSPAAQREPSMCGTGRRAQKSATYLLTGSAFTTAVCSQALVENPNGAPCHF